VPKISTKLDADIASTPRPKPDLQCSKRRPGPEELTDKSRLDQAVSFLNETIVEKPFVAVILGSGLGGFAEELEEQRAVPASSVPFFPISTVQGHEGKLAFGRVTTRARTSLPLLVFKGRVHFYESGDLEPVLFPVRLAAAFGCRVLIVTNASGAIARHLGVGDLMLIKDFLNCAFLDLRSAPYGDGDNILHHKGRTDFFDISLQEMLRGCARDLGMTLHEGTYCWLKGPSYETPAEIEMLRRIGADSVGMSTIPEVMAARELGLRVVGISLISNLAAGIGGERLSHDEVAEAGRKVKERFSGLLREFLVRIQA
jgi:purine-nucleoside phosphorylase